MPKRIQRRRTKGWRMPEGAVYVGRPTRWGNPFDLRREEHCWTAVAHGFKGHRAGRIAASVAMYREWLMEGRAVKVTGCGLYAETPDGDKPIATSPDAAAGTPPTLNEIRNALAGRDLVCWCPLDQPCHADALLEMANAPGIIRAGRR